MRKLAFVLLIILVIPAVFADTSLVPAPILTPAPTPPTASEATPDQPKPRPVDISHLMKAPPPAENSGVSNRLKASCTSDGKNFKKGEAGYENCLLDSARATARSRVSKPAAQNSADGATISLDLLKNK